MRFETILKAALHSQPSDEQIAEQLKGYPEYKLTSALTGWSGRTIDPENVQDYLEYAEPGYTQPKTGILLGNWNDCSRRVQDLLERAGYELEWEDEWMSCGDCNKLVRESPDSYGWLPSYAILNDCEVICIECLKDNPTEYLESIEDKPTHACIPSIDPSEHGYTLLEDKFESGFHPSQNDNPKKIWQRLHDLGYKGLVFKLDSKGQFDISFSVYQRNEDK